ncbi:MAG: DoxX family membrane protein [Firmicutes bacterium]|nr:DoxX family membrane protein [Bacillota bacterium]
MRFFKDRRFSVLWAVVRIWLGWQWLEAGLGKITSPVWAGNKAGVAVGGFLQGALAKATGDHPLVQGWYAAFIKSFALPQAKLFSYLVAYGEVLVGIALLLGTFTVFAAVLGALMNLNYMLAGTTSTNPVMYTLAILVIIAGANAGLIGLDYWLRPFVSGLVGKNWRAGGTQAQHAH